jgi:ABC-type sugar transport system ATPase subunit
VRELSLPDPARPARRLLDRISFDVRRGEVLGLAGLAGSGASSALLALFGALGPVDAVSVRLGGAAFAPRSPRDSIARGLVLLAADRGLSLVSTLAIAENASLSALARWSQLGRLDRRAEQAVVRELLDQLGTSGATALDAPVRTLSGGNQQKVALARCLLAAPRVLLLDEPTRGIDVGAKADVARLVRELSAAGVAIVVVSSELEELIALADRVLVLARGRVVDELERPELSRERVLASAMGAAS